MANGKKYENSEIVAPDLSVTVRMLTSGGFILEDAQRHPGYTLIFASRYDEFGAAHVYCFVLAEDRLSAAQVEAARIAADYHGAQLVLIGHSDEQVLIVDWQRFVSLFGGPVLSTHPTESSFANELIQLGHNQLPEGLQGKPDDLFERHVRVALEFLLGGRVIRYGQDRRFEARADGIVLPTLDLSALYDAKAYSEGYKITANSIRQFKSYVEDFTSRYRAYLSNLKTFLVISGHFPQRESTLAGRARDLLDECRVPLCCVSASALGEMVQLLSCSPQLRWSIRWSRIFADPVVKPEKVLQEIEAITKDQIIRRC